jgi:hypothetical protein
VSVKPGARLEFPTARESAKASTIAIEPAAGTCRPPAIGIDGCQEQRREEERQDAEAVPVEVQQMREQRGEDPVGVLRAPEGIHGQRLVARDEPAGVGAEGPEGEADQESGRADRDGSGDFPDVCAEALPLPPSSRASAPCRDGATLTGLRSSERRARRAGLTAHRRSRNVSARREARPRADLARVARRRALLSAARAAPTSRTTSGSSGTTRTSCPGRTSEPSGATTTGAACRTGCTGR